MVVSRWSAVTYRRGDGCARGRTFAPWPGGKRVGQRETMGDGWTGPEKSKRIGKGEDEQNFEGARESGVLGWDRQDRQDRNRHETLSFSEQARCSLSVPMGRHYPFIRGEGRSGRGVPAATAAEVPVLPPYRLVSRGTYLAVVQCSSWPCLHRSNGIEANATRS